MTNPIWIMSARPRRRGFPVNSTGLLIRDERWIEQRATGWRKAVYEDGAAVTFGTVEEFMRGTDLKQRVSFHAPSTRQELAYDLLTMFRDDSRQRQEWSFSHCDQGRV
jgi:hypothetical protein